MIGLIKSTLRMPAPWLVWIVLLGGANFVAPLFFLNTIEAQGTLALGFAGVLIQTQIHTRLGFVRLLGIGYIFWIPFVVWLSFRLGLAGFENAFGLWLLSLLVLNAISLVIDTIDVTRFILGERKPFY